jgi:Phage protein (N4 Gp49/phage Sf6 gene 66) family
MSLQSSDAEAASVSTAPRVSLAIMEAKIAARYDIRGNEAIPDGAPSIASLSLLSICILIMQNGFTIIGKSAPASAANFNADLGRKLAYEDAIRQLWPLEGYALREHLMAGDAAVPA